MCLPIPVVVSGVVSLFHKHRPPYASLKDGLFWVIYTTWRDVHRFAHTAACCDKIGDVRVYVARRVMWMFRRGPYVIETVRYATQGAHYTR